MSTISLLYCIASCLSLLLLIGYSLFVRKKEPWFYLLFAGVLIANIGYFALSVSKTLEEALLANRISYFGSVFLPMTMLMIIYNLTQVKCKRWLPSLLVAVGVVVFIFAASPGYSALYYKEVSYQTINGTAFLQKVYGPWHNLYPIYLAGYFSSMIYLTVYAFVKKKMVAPVHCVFLVTAVFVNICIWFVEQFIKFDFEFLSLSYIISEIFLLSLYLLLQHDTESKAPAPAPAPITTTIDKRTKELQKQLQKGLPLLTKTEKLIFDFYLEDKTTKDILTALNITENTLKFHNKNLYSKLGVSSRRQLKEIARL